MFIGLLFLLCGGEIDERKILLSEYSGEHLDYADDYDCDFLLGERFFYDEALEKYWHEMENEND